MDFQEQDYRRILQGKLKERCERNSRYTQGAFARFLGISHSRLSEILSGKQGLSVKWAVRIAEKLKFSGLEKEHFCQLVLAEHSRSPVQKQRSKVSLRKQALKTFPALSQDIFDIISEWQHLAILELVSLNPNISEQSMSRKLKLPVQNIEASMSRLLRTGQLIKTANGLSPAHDLTMSTQDIPSQAIKNHHKGISERAQNALDKDAVEFREFSSVILSADKGKMKELKSLLRELRDKFCVEVDQLENKNSVYCLQLQFFRLDEDTE